MSIGEALTIITPIVAILLASHIAQWWRLGKLEGMMHQALIARNLQEE